MAYTLSASQMAAITAERNQLQVTVDTYDSQAFIDATNTGVTAANDVDNAAFLVWQSAVESTDGTQPRETVLSQLDGLTPNRTVAFEDMEDDNPLYDMGAIQPVIDDITDAVTTNALNVESSRRIRLTINRYYPDVDDKDDNAASDSRNVFPDNPFFAYAATNRGEKDYQDLNTIFQEGIFGNGGRGTPASITGNGPDPAGITAGSEATGGNAQTQVTSIETVNGSTIPVTVGDNESFLIYISNYLSTLHFRGGLDGMNTLSNVNNLSIQGTTAAGTGTITSTNTGLAPSDPATYVPVAGDVLSETPSGAEILVVQADQVSFVCANSGMGVTEMRTCTRVTNIRYIILDRIDPVNGGLSNGTQGPQATTNSKRADYLALKRFTTAIPAGATNIATPAINTQQEVADEIVRVTAELGTQTSLIYQQKYNIANTRCNWNNGTLSAFISRENSRLNLFNPNTLLSMGLITTIVDYVNEYTRTVAKIAELQAILDGST